MNGRGWLGGPPWFRLTTPWWPWWGGWGLGGSLGKSPSGPWPGWLKPGPGGPKPMWPWPGSCCWWWWWWWRLWLLLIRGLGPWWSNMCCPGNLVDSVRSVHTWKTKQQNRDVRFFFFPDVVLWPGKQQQITLSRWHRKRTQVVVFNSVSTLWLIRKKEKRNIDV